MPTAWEVDDSAAAVFMADTNVPVHGIGVDITCGRWTPACLRVPMGGRLRADRGRPGGHQGLEGGHRRAYDVLTVDEHGACLRPNSSFLPRTPHAEISGRAGGRRGAGRRVLVPKECRSRAHMGSSADGRLPVGCLRTCP
jgi:hypothetical protein